MEQPTEPPPRVEMTADSALFSLQHSFGRLAALAAEVVEVEVEIRTEVDVARSLGVTWAQIAEVAGVKPQSAYQRWTDTGRQKHREYEKKRRDSYTRPTS